MQTLSLSEYNRRLRGCFVGKAVGGTLGMPMEGHLGTKPFTYYDPVPTSMVANDDLDLQVVWLECLRQNGLPVNRKHLGDAWLDHVRIAPDEYGVALRNLGMGLQAPLCGYFGSAFTAGMGAAIRSEIWAALAPGDPALAIRLCREDAAVDHDADGVEAAVFLTAVESAAYLEADRDKLVATGLSFLNPDGRLARALRDTDAWWRADGDYLRVRGRILEKYAVDNWTDVTVNLALILLAWRAGGGDFGRSICIAAEMGYDAECTCATLGAILGLLRPDDISEEWTKPLGDDLVLSDCIVAMHETDKIGAFCGQIAAMAWQVQQFYGAAARFDAAPAPDAGCAAPWAPSDAGVSLTEGYSHLDSLVAVQPYVLNLRYPASVALAAGKPERFTATVQNPNGPLACRVRLTVPAGWQVEPAEFQCQAAQAEPAAFSFTVTAPAGGRVSCRNFLRFGFETGDMTFAVLAGLVQCIPWRRAAVSYEGDACPPDALFERAVADEAPGAIAQAPAGPQLYVLDVIAPYRMADLALICEGTRPLTVWVDGQPVLSHAAEQFVPALHRSGHRAMLSLTAGTHSIVIRVADGAPGPLFFGMGDPGSWMWMPDLQYNAH